MTHELTFREIECSELDQLLYLYKHLHANDFPLPPKEKVEKVWQNICDNPELLYLGAYVGDILVSTCNLSIIQNMTRGCKPYGMIENVCTHPKHRRQKIGKRLIQYTLNIAWKNDCYKTMLLTGRKNKDVHKFYISSGFDPNAKQAFLAKP